ncbi:AarF/ABC1/UbiB kinase family protein [Novosphingobium sp. CCH12-A3]|uniref:ABC1 kinase family protein n=1 Tax=Novosphingobium sp. CCH12-A3 TaxID=1768752 RepID=UPI000783D8C4|nr:AarF/UbiB family protein [Novosphingobium sp. CCH12-A3]
MMKSLIVAHRDRARLQEILGIASRFGLGVLLKRLGLERVGSVEGEAGEDLPRRARLAIESLGPTFVKLGQILATRGDLLPREWIAELEQLHSRAPTLSFEELRAAVEEVLGEPPETAFASFDPEPLAAASMAQVHRATLHDGREVVLKIRRPGIRPRMEADLRLIAQLAAVAEAASAEARRFAPAAMMRQLAEAVLEELDFTNEGRNADRLRADFAHEPRVLVPDIHWSWSSEMLLVMDYVDGTPPRGGDILRAADIDPAAIAALGADTILDMVLINGRFHGDPHPGNLLCLPDNRIALLDLGMIGHVSPRRREEFIAFVQSLNGGDPAQLADVLAGWSAGSGVPPERVQVAAERLVARHGGGRLVLSAMVADFLPLMREEGMTMPPDLLLIFKALVTIDGVLSAIQPGFDLSEAMQRSSLRIARARLSPEHWGPILQAFVWELAKIGDDAPHLVRAAIRRLETGPTTGPPPDQLAALSMAGRWIAGAIVAGATIVAAALLLR